MHVHSVVRVVICNRRYSQPLREWAGLRVYVCAGRPLRSVVPGGACLACWWGTLQGVGSTCCWSSTRLHTVCFWLLRQPQCLLMCLCPSLAVSGSCGSV